MVVRFDRYLSSGVPDLQESAFWASAYLMLAGSEESSVLPMRCFGWSQASPVMVSFQDEGFSMMGGSRYVPGGSMGSYKVWAGGAYSRYASETDASAGRDELLTRGFISGPVQSALTSGKSEACCCPPAKPHKKVKTIRKTKIVHGKSMAGHSMAGM